jgi:hypothetical protein
VRHEVAVWAGISAFFANLVGIGVIDLINGGQKAQIAAAVVASMAVAGGVYAKARLDDAKAGKNGLPPQQ